jgi:hypothetical protein
MTMQFAVAGGHITLDKAVFAKEILTPGSPLKKLIQVEEGMVPPKIVKAERSVTIEYNNASDVRMDEDFHELFKKLKAKYKEKITGKVVIRITALTSYYVVLDLNRGDERVVYE